MANGSSIVVNSADFQKAIQAQKIDVDIAAGRIVRRGGQLIAKKAKEQFQGNTKEPAGGGRPHRRTGALADSIDVHKVDRLEPGRWSSMTYGTTAYARRLELGFLGVDALGRKYGPPINPAKYPYLSPAVKESRRGLKEIYTLEWEAALKHG